MTVHFVVVESRAGHLHLHIEGESRLACGRAGECFQVVMGQRLRAAPFCRPCLRAVQRRVQKEG